ncbi:hypothetical protein SAMN05216351_1313 [Pseudobutyrivibrio sp. JW11]|uniref:hypothetical protein n=1 Tax=Pseudobutyrivibrio ruminis TaxID=46206 RepID=UPI0008ED7EA5|nr:hypothetical protein [Pseudobutyrivibrio ruminis]MBE6025069.1 hypothetical protein [Cellulosilyticum sp.]SFO67439.1 hypothetical protein SAMN05216351_1313 [Pseudobutyrivibrio sp. JW11]
MKRLFKFQRTFFLVLCIASIMSYTTIVCAQPYQVKTDTCPRCGHSNQSYGYDPEFSSHAESYKAGQRCRGCGQIVKEKEIHLCEYYNDKYYFMCNSNNCRRFNVPDRIYTREYSNPIKYHYVSTIYN